MKRSILPFLLSAVLALSLCFTGLTASAATDGIITLDTVTAVEGDSVIINLTISENPGIMAMTISVTYDPEVLTYEKYMSGILNDYLVADHPDKKLLRFVNCEKKEDNTLNGALVSLQFKVKEGAPAGMHPVTIDYKSGDFCNYNLRRVMPTIVAGGVKIDFDGQNCNHKYSEWDIKSPSCTAEGAKQHSCTICGHTEIASIEATGHSYSPDWTVDKAATQENNGSMSRHCTNRGCGVKVDATEFTVEDAAESGFENTVGVTVKAGVFKKAVATEQPTMKPQKDDIVSEPDVPQPDIAPEEIPEQDAAELITSVKEEESRTALNKILIYFFGEDGKSGLFGTMGRAFKINRSYAVILIAAAYSVITIL